MLLGRGPEENLLDRLLQSARSGRSAVLALVGEAGSGKSALLDHAAARAPDMQLLRARGVQSEAQIPFAGLLELLRPALVHLEALPGPQREALEGALAMRPARSQDRFAIGAATLGLLAAHTDAAPLLVLVDDAHWLDPSSADALLFAVRRLFADPVTVVLGVREGEPSLLDGSDLTVHRLGGLDLAATSALVARHARSSGPVADDVVGRLHRTTAGNPLAVIELVDGGAVTTDDVSFDPALPVVTSVGRVYLDRWRALPGPVRDVVLLAAVCDTDELPTLARAAAVAGLDVDGLAAAGPGLIDVVGDRVVFRHPMVRSAVYAAAPTDLRRDLHRVVAGVLPDADADRRAWHLALAATGPDDGVCSALAQAGARARERSAFAVAARDFERAASLSPDPGRRAGLLLAAAESSWLHGSAARAVTLVDEARRGTPGPEVAIGLEHLRGHIATRLGPVGEGRRILLAAAATAAPRDPDRAVEMLAEAVNASFYAGDATAMREAADRITPLADSGLGRRAAFFAALARGMALIFGRADDRDGADLVRRAVALVEGTDELAGDPRLLAWAAMGPLWLRESGTRLPLVDRALELAHQRSAVGVLPFLLDHVAIDRMAADRWPEAEASFHEAIDLARATGQRTDLAFALARLAWLEARQGNDVACRDHTAEARRLADELDLGLVEIWATTALAELELGLGHAAAALAHFEAAHALLGALRIGDVDLRPEPELVELHLRLGRPEEAAVHLLASYEREAEAKGQPWALARAARCRGLLAPDDEVDRHFADALDRHGETPDLFETARTRLLYGVRLRRRRQRVRAREHLVAAVDAFDRLGAAPWSDLARAELAATGVTARRRDLSTRDRLTPQELQIALLLAGGRTTREAAATLFLSPKTIEYHLRSVYRKLGVNSRPALAAALERGP